MDFYDVLDQVLDLLRQRGRVAYRVLKLQFKLDDETLEALKDELIYSQQLAVDAEGKVLVWAGDSSSASALAAAPAEDRAPLAYTPSHLTDKILAARPALEGERKQVTVLFADLKDSTELIRGLDPEAAQQLLDPAIHLMMDAVHRFEGTVNQVLGDGIMALFGAPLPTKTTPCAPATQPWPCRRPCSPPPRRYAARAAWSCACVWASIPGKWWCGPLATTCIWTTRRSGRPRSWRRVWNRWPRQGASA